MFYSRDTQDWIARVWNVKPGHEHVNVRQMACYDVWQARWDSRPLASWLHDRFRPDALNVKGVKDGPERVKKASHYESLKSSAESCVAPILDSAFESRKWPCFGRRHLVGLSERFQIDCGLLVRRCGGVVVDPFGLWRPGEPQEQKSLKIK